MSNIFTREFKWLILVIALTGIQLKAKAQCSNPSGSCPITFSPAYPTYIQFGNDATDAENGTGTYTIVVTNSGSTSVTGLALSLDASDGSFTISNNNCTSILAAQATCTFVLVWDAQNAGYNEGGVYAYCNGGVMASSHAVASACKASYAQQHCQTTYTFDYGSCSCIPV